MATRYRIDDFQQSYFVIRDFDSLLADTARDFGPIYAGFDDGAAHAPQDVLPDDRVFHKGTQAHFRA